MVWDEYAPPSDEELAQWMEKFAQESTDRKLLYFRVSARILKALFAEHPGYRALAVQYHFVHNGGEISTEVIGERG